jgi:hypothetical protein
MTKLLLSDDLSLPLDFITQTAGILAIRGAGKSNLAAVLAEQMFRAKLPFCVVDPTGTWVGLRSAGSSPGLPVVIFGGPEFDVPLERGGGPMVADLIAEERLSSVVDVSEFSEADKCRFLAEFAQRLYQKNRDPLHLFLEEADDYVPQKPGKLQLACLGAFETIVRRGRSRGLGITMITQRSAVINKNILTQIETLFVLRTTSPQDRKAVSLWVDFHGQSRELVESLPTLKPGEAWVWSPHYLEVVKRIQVHRRTTLDTAATPKDVHGRRPIATKADVDLEAVTAKMRETIERAKADDPKELRKALAERNRRILDLEKQVTGKIVKTAAPKVELKKVEVPVVKDAQIRRLEAAVGKVEGALATLNGAGVSLSEIAKDVSDSLRSAVGAAKSANSTLSAPAIPPLPRLAPRPAPPSRGTAARPRPNGHDTSGETKLGKCELAILAALAQFPEGLVARRLAILSGYTWGGGYRNRLSTLRTAGYIEGGNTETMKITAAGQEAIDSHGWEPLPPPGDPLLDYWKARASARASGRSWELSGRIRKGWKRSRSLKPRATSGVVASGTACRRFGRWV